MKTTKVAGLTPGAVLPALAASEQHVRLIVAKREHLAEVLGEAENQYLAAVRREWDSGTMTYTQLLAAYEVVCLGKLPNRRMRWNMAFPFSVEKVRAQAAREPDGDGVWRGENPIAQGHAYPLSGLPVVYVLFDTSYTPVYVGSTQRFRNRMEDHRRVGKVWKYWLAHPCRDRAHAYEVESRFLSQYMPALNIQGPQQRKAAA